MRTMTRLGLGAISCCLLALLAACNTKPTKPGGIAVHREPVEVERTRVAPTPLGLTRPPMEPALPPIRTNDDLLNDRDSCRAALRITTCYLWRIESLGIDPAPECLL